LHGNQSAVATTIFVHELDLPVDPNISVWSFSPDATNLVDEASKFENSSALLKILIAYLWKLHFALLSEQSDQTGIVNNRIPIGLVDSLMVDFVWSVLEVQS
jgi:hypothetical protein